MLPRFRILLIFLAAFAVGASQLFGIQSGWLCGCTGEPSPEAYCEPGVCHPVQTCCQENCGDHDQHSQAPAPEPHEHTLLTDALDLVTPPVWSSPVVVWFVLPPAFQWDPLPLRELPQPGRETRKPPGEGNPAMPVLVARTMVMLV